MTLKELQIGKSAVVDTVGGSGALRQHFLDMGLIPGAEVTLVKLAPMGDPMELRIHGYELTLRLDDAAQIGITPTEKAPAMSAAPADDKMVDHPGLGEGGKYHIKKGENPLPEDRTLTFALAGNQNCGKTTLFNQLTGSNQHVGNFPGVTVDRKSGAIKGHPETEVTDLPGIYSMSPYSSEEIVTRQFIIGEKPTGIINIVDATNIERNLYLTMQLMELDIPMVLALNMMDEMRGNGGTVRINKMEAMLGIPVIPISAAKNEGVDELVDHAVHVAKYQERPGRMDFCSEDDHGGAVHRCIHGILHLIEDHAKAAGIPVRFAATKLVEGDPRIEEALKLDPNEKEMIEHIIVQMEQERGLDRAAAIADMRFSFIQELVAQTVVKPHESKEQLRSNRIDKFLTGKYTAIPAFIAIMGLVFFLTFNVIGLFFQNLMEMGIDALTGVVDTALTNWNVNAAVHSLVIDGIFTGVGSVLSFLPIIVVLFFFLSMLEDTGYMARVAFVMDKLLRRIGLSGRSIVPMLIGFGCTVPGVMASRTLPSERDRKMTILLTPFMSCSAKLPIYSLFAAAFFPKYAGLVMVLLYFTGILVGVLAADVSLYAPDFAAAERTFELLVQAAGRAGRWRQAGTALIQTYMPEHYSIQTAAAQDYGAFYRQEMGYRRLMHYPPACHMLCMQVAGENEELMSRIMDAIAGSVQKHFGEAAEIIGPVPAPVYKVHDIYRKILYMKHENYDILIKIQKYVKMRWDETESCKKLTLQCDFI